MRISLFRYTYSLLLEQYWLKTRAFTRLLPSMLYNKEGHFKRESFVHTKIINLRVRAFNFFKKLFLYPGVH